MASRAERRADCRFLFVFPEVLLTDVTYYRTCVSSAAAVMGTAVSLEDIGHSSWIERAVALGLGVVERSRPQPPRGARGRRAALRAARVRARVAPLSADEGRLRACHRPRLVLLLP